MSTNIAIIVGRLGQDPEVRETKGETTITTLSVATDRPSYKDGKTYKNDNGYTAMDTSWHRVTVVQRPRQDLRQICEKRHDRRPSTDASSTASTPTRTASSAGRPRSSRTASTSTPASKAIPTRMLTRNRLSLSPGGFPAGAFLYRIP